MSKTRTITATHDGLTFKRLTHRIYSHVIIGRPDIEAFVAQVRKGAEWNTRTNWRYYYEVADGSYRHMEYVSDAERERAKGLVALGIDAAIKQEVDKAEQRARKDKREKWEPLSWAGRPDLAAKQVAEWKKPIHCYAEVLAIPVDA